MSGLNLGDGLNVHIHIHPADSCGCKTKFTGIRGRTIPGPDTDTNQPALGNVCEGQPDGLPVCIDGEVVVDTTWPPPNPPQTGGPWRLVWNPALDPPGYDWENAGGGFAMGQPVKPGTGLPAKLASELPRWVEGVRGPYLERRRRK